MMYQIPLLKMQLNDIRRKYFKPINPNNNSGCNNNGNYYQYSNTIEAGTSRFKFICTYHYKHLLICLIKFTLITRDPSTFKKSTSNAQSVYHDNKLSLYFISIDLFLIHYSSPSLSSLSSLLNLCHCTHFLYYSISLNMTHTLPTSFILTGKTRLADKGRKTEQTSNLPFPLFTFHLTVIFFSTFQLHPLRVHATN